MVISTHPLHFFPSRLCNNLINGASPPLPLLMLQTTLVICASLTADRDGGTVTGHYINAIRNQGHQVTCVVRIFWS